MIELFCYEILSQSQVHKSIQLLRKFHAELPLCVIYPLNFFTTIAK